MAAVIGLTSTCYLSFEFHLFLQTRRFLLKYLILELTILREVLCCASGRCSFILLELAAMMLSTPPRAQPLGRVAETYLPSYYAPRYRCCTSMNTCNSVSSSV